MKQISRAVSWVSREVPAWANRHKVWAGIGIVLALLAVVVYLPRVPGVGPRSGREAEGEFRGHLLQALGGLVLGVGAYFTGRTFALNREGQITERFTRAVEQLANKEQLDIRLGGIYALERIARDSKTHYEPVMEVLTAFLREHARWRPESEAVHGSVPATTGDTPCEPERPPRPDFQAAARVLATRDRRHERPGYRLVLREVDLRWALLRGVDIDLQNARFEDAHLECADFRWAHLEGAHLQGTQLDGTRLQGAFLSRVRLEGTDLRKAIGLTQRATHRHDQGRRHEASRVPRTRRQDDPRLKAGDGRDPPARHLLASF
jgi:Pentapeptide repeats (8 copies)